MPISGEFNQHLQQLANHIPMWVDVMIGFAGLWGLFMWLFGHRMIRPTVTITGLVAGAVIGGLIGRSMLEGNAVVFAAIGGGVVGAIATWMLFRIWMAVLLAVTLAAMAPWAVIAWEGVTPPPSPVADLKETAKQILEDGMDNLAPNGESDGPIIFGRPENDEQAAEQNEGLAKRITEAAKAGWENLRTWWSDELSGSARWLIITASAAMALSGLMIGLIFPNLGAATVASLIGSIVLLSAAVRLGTKYLGDAGSWLPSSPRGMLIGLLAMTVVGALIQWTILRPRADK